MLESIWLSFFGYICIDLNIFYLLKIWSESTLC